jgi:hypothetical protein
MMGLLSHTNINTNKDGAPELVILPLQSEVKAIFQNTPYSMPSAPSHQPSTENPTGNKESPFRRKRIESHHFRPESDEQEDPTDPENPV